MTTPTPSGRRPCIALVGRSNVGKSALWNRLTETTRALVSDQPHTTRDRNYGLVQWRGLVFDVVDTGGMDVEPDEIGAGIDRQARHGIAQADIVFFVVDVLTGVTREDLALARIVQKMHKHIWLIANKTDKPRYMGQATSAEMYRLGLGDPRPMSAATGLGIGDLLDETVSELERLGHPAVPLAEVLPLRIAIIGRPNVGKSSLMNAITGEERVIVSPIAHTTREPQDTWLRYRDRDIVLVDTAGMRKKSHVEGTLEHAGIRRNEKAVADADVAFLVFDATNDPTAQDRHLAGYLETANKGLILVANKWDLVEGKLPVTANEYEKLIRQSFPFLSWAPVVFVSAKERQRTHSLLDLAIEVEAERHRHIDYNALNKLLKGTIKSMKPLASYGPKSPRIYDVAQTGDAPPTFVITVHGEKEGVHKNWVRFFEKRLREKFGFTGTPISISVHSLPVSKSARKRNVHGPGMEAVAGKIKEKERLVNQTRRRQKGR